MKAASSLDYRELARRRLPKFLFEYIDGGSYAEVTLARNVRDLESIELRQRVLRDVGKLDLTCELFGQKLALPVALGPIGLAGLNARRGEVQAARAAEAAGVPFCLSTMSACPLEEVTRAASQPLWFQLYMIRDRAFMRDLLARAREAKCSALVFTVDLPVLGSRYRDYRSGLAGAPGLSGTVRRAWQGLMRPAWAWDVGIRGRPYSLGNVAPLLGKSTGLEDFFAWTRNNVDSTVTWRDLEFVRSEWPGPLIIKGILEAEDAVSAADAGADGIVVSNHGGRQLDGVPSTARALPPIVDAVGDCRQRRAFRPRRRAHAGARRARRLARSCLGLCARCCRSARRRSCTQADRGRNARRDGTHRRDRGSEHRSPHTRGVDYTYEFG
jgi:L-lactate dehydrogenase (cytochrome)